ncbi:MAG TPA: hypothetical protein V6D17_22065 [Candidatus Obscuribacterales bacterium]
MVGSIGQYTQPEKSEYDRLIDEHEEALFEIQQRHLSFARNTIPCDRPRAEQAMSELYKRDNLPPPAFIWVDSPLEAALAAPLVIWWAQNESGGSYDDPSSILPRHYFCFERRPFHAVPQLMFGQRKRFVERLLNIQPRELRVGLAARYLTRISAVEVAGEMVLRDVRREMTQRLSAANPLDVWHRTWEKLRNSPLPEEYVHNLDLGAQLLFTLDTSVHQTILQNVQAEMVDFDLHGRPMFGQFQAGIVAADELLSELGITSDGTAERYRDLVAHAGMCWPFNKVCLMVDRPKKMSFDPAMDLHDVDGMAVEYQDGWGIYAVVGVVVPERIARGRFAAKEIDAERSLEVRRAMMSLYGIGNYLHDTKARVIHQDKFGVLYRRRIPDDDDLVVVKLTNSTPEPDGTYKTYFLRVPPNIRTARAAWPGHSG